MHDNHPGSSALHGCGRPAVETFDPVVRECMGRLREEPQPRRRATWWLPLLRQACILVVWIVIMLVFFPSMLADTAGVLVIAAIAVFSLVFSLLERD
jgi:hypothetical protein